MVKTNTGKKRQATNFKNGFLQRITPHKHYICRIFSTMFFVLSPNLPSQKKNLPNNEQCGYSQYNNFNNLKCIAILSKSLLKRKNLKQVRLPTNTFFLVYIYQQDCKKRHKR